MSLECPSLKTHSHFFVISSWKHFPIAILDAGSIMEGPILWTVVQLRSKFIVSTSQKAPSHSVQNAIGSHQRLQLGVAWRSWGIYRALGIIPTQKTRMSNCSYRLFISMAETCRNCTNIFFTPAKWPGVALESWDVLGQWGSQRSRVSPHRCPVPFSLQPAAGTGSEIWRQWKQLPPETWIHHPAMATAQDKEQLFNIFDKNWHNRNQ